MPVDREEIPIVRQVEHVPVDLEGHDFGVKVRMSDELNCAQCHDASFAEVPKEGNQLSHWQVDLNHAAGMQCTNCHQVDQPQNLITLEGTVNFDHSYMACGKCHQHQLKSWEIGAHGKRAVGWKEDRIIYNCTECHNPHSPSLPKELPVAKPKIIPDRLQKDAHK